MKNINAVIWLLPVLFMLHDFEEIILVEAWRSRYADQLGKRRPGRLVFAGCKRTPAFSIGVAIEFFLLALITGLSGLTGRYGVWYGLLFAFTAHLVGHCVVPFLYRHYVPGVVTSVLLLPGCGALLYGAGRALALTGTGLVVNCAIGTGVMLVLILGLHRCMGCFEKWVEAFGRG